MHDIVYIDSFARLKFFISLKLFKKSRNDLQIITISPGVKWFLNKRGYTVKLILKQKLGIIDINTEVYKVEKFNNWNKEEISSFIFQLKNILNITLNLLVTYLYLLWLYNMFIIYI